MADRKKDKQRSTKHHTENKDGAMRIPSTKTTTTKPEVNSGALEGCAVPEKSTESYILHMQVLIVFIPQKTINLLAVIFE
jgi:hypothetical protein